MIRILILALVVFGAPGSASAEAVLSIRLGTGATSGLTSATYSCDGGEPFTVQYVNAGANALAVLPLDGEERIFVNVVSGSGARYVSGQYVWWSRGDSATLENELEDAKKTCLSQNDPGTE